MSQFWKNWLSLWCLAVALFGLLLAGAAFEATDGAARVLFALMGDRGEPVFDAHLRFSTSLMGCVTFGWATTFYAAFHAAFALGEQGRPIWRLITAGLVVWYIIDSAASVATGFPVNALSNTLLLAGYLIPLLATGMLQSTRTPHAYT